MALEIRPLKKADQTAWERLWIENNQGQIRKTITEETWRRLLDPRSGVLGLGAWHGAEMAGLVHYILHPVTGHIAYACYMQDLFVSPAFRRQGIGRALVEHLTAKARAAKWARLYWLAADDNREAQALYSNLGLKLGFSFYVMPL